MSCTTASKSEYVKYADICQADYTALETEGAANDSGYPRIGSFFKKFVIVRKPGVYEEVLL